LGEGDFGFNGGSARRTSVYAASGGDCTMEEDENDSLVVAVVVEVPALGVAGSGLLLIMTCETCMTEVGDWLVDRYESGTRLSALQFPLLSVSVWSVVTVIIPSASESLVLMLLFTKDVGSYGL